MDRWVKKIFKNNSFNKLYNDFLIEKRILTSEDNYIKYEQIGRLYLKPNIGDTNIYKITELMWQDCINKAYKKGLSKKTLKNIKGTITTFCRYTKKAGLKLEPPEFVEIPRNAYTKKKIILQPNDIITLMTDDTVIIRGEEIKDYFIHAYRFIFLTGIRRGEACALENQALKNDYVHIYQSYNTRNVITEGKTDNSNRYFKLTSYAKKELEYQKKMLNRLNIKSKYIFPDTTGEIVKPIKLFDSWKRYRKQHNIQSSIHELRHTFISVAKADVPKSLLQKAAGHSESMDTIGIYGHEVNGEAERTANILDSIYSKIISTI